MVDEKKGKRTTGIGSVKGTKESGRVKRTDAVGDVKAVRSVGSVGSIGKSGTGNASRSVTEKQRAEILKLIEQEAQQLFKDNKISKQRQRIIEKAVKIAIDSSLEIEPNTGSKKK